MVDHKDIQGNILRFHGRPQAIQLIGVLHSDREGEVRKWLRSFTETYVKSAEDQQIDTKDWKDSNKQQERPVITIALGALAYKKAGFKEADPAFPKDPLFQAGLHAYNSTRLTTDQYHNALEGHYLSVDEAPTLDLMISIAHQIPAEQEKLLQRITQDALFKKTWLKFWLEYGLNNTHYGQEHYSVGPLGFADGLSTPTVTKTIEEAAILQNVNKYQDNGSYLSFRKIRVNPGYWAALITRITKVYKVSRALAEAMIMGRFRNGTPLASYQRPQLQSEWRTADVNHIFDYSTNPKFCPFQAHARVVNPRDGSEGLPIIRRSMSYADESESGLLFMSYQKSLTRQFKPILQRIKKHKDFLLYADGGVNNEKEFIFPEYPTARKEKLLVNEKQMPILRGGEYLFTPPISMLKGL